jgi:membrane-associated phospholipid phosphatase
VSRRSLIFTAFLGLIALGITWIAALPAGISGLEESGFRLFNNLPDWIEYPGWPIMQLGSILAVPIVAITCAVLFRDWWRIPIQVTAAGVGAWVIAKILKDLVDRGRPEAFFSDINLRPAWDGLGFPSGHSAVAFAIAVVLVAAVAPRMRTGIWTIAVLTGLLRLYTGAHFPLDVVGGWGLGAAVGATVELAWRSIRQRDWFSRPDTQ